MRTTIEYMQLCHIHLYQKIARKKVARVNAANSNPLLQALLNLRSLKRRGRARCVWIILVVSYFFLVVTWLAALIVCML